jgi:DNA repair protein RadD
MPSKENTLVLDFAGNVARHGPVDAIEVKDKASAGGEGAVPTKVCPICRVDRGRRRCTTCTVCGFEFPKPERPPILPEASDLPILSTEPSPTTLHDVNSVSYHYHQRDENKTPTLCVEYYFTNGVGFSKLIAREWLCFEHTGFARNKAESWWKRRTNEPPPDDDR